MIAGDTDQYKEIGYNFLVEGDVWESQLERVDLDKDGTYDIEFFSGEKQTGNFGTHKVTLKTLHDNIQIHTDIRQDSMFFAYFYTWLISPEGTPTYFHVDKISCHRETEQFQPIGVESEQILDSSGRRRIVLCTR